jgi:hypothetical protein
MKAKHKPKNTFNMTAEEYITNRLDSQIDWYNTNSMKHRKKYYWLKATEITLAAVTPFLVAYSNKNEWIQLLAGLFAIVIGIVAGLLIAFKYHEKWVQYRTTCESLLHEKYLYLTQSGVYAQNPSFQLFVERVEYLTSKENSSWAMLVKQTVETKKS